MSKNAAARTSESTRPQVDQATAPKLEALNVVLDRSKDKLREELLRFRTCCADPRASK